MARNKVLNGTFGRVWVNDMRMSGVKKFEAKVTMDYETINFQEELGDDYEYMGYSIEGTMVLHKMDSRMAIMLADGIQTGNLPDTTMVGRLSDPRSHGHERVLLEGVVFDELTLISMENKTIGEEEVPFKAARFKYLDKIPMKGAR